MVSFSSFVTRVLCAILTKGAKNGGLRQRKTSKNHDSDLLQKEDEKEEEKEKALENQSMNRIQCTLLSETVSEYLLRAHKKYRFEVFKPETNEEEKEKEKEKEKETEEKEEEKEKEVEESKIPWEIPSETSRKYALISGDLNPIHLYPITAKVFGMRSNIIHGMWNMSKAVSYILESHVSKDVLERFAREGDDEKEVVKVSELFGNDVKSIEAIGEFKRPVFLPFKGDFVVKRSEGGRREDWEILFEKSGKVGVQGSVRFVEKE